MVTILVDSQLIYMGIMPSFHGTMPLFIPLKDVIVEAFQTVFPEVLGGYEKIRFKGLDFESDHLFGQEAADTFTILENGVTYEVFLNDGLMTGIFLDQHEVRDGLV